MSRKPNIAKKKSSRDWLSGGGEMGKLIREVDWSRTPLGPIESWPQSLRTAVRIMLTSRQPFWLGWGEQLINLYNDPYKAIVGGKHPTALGQPVAVVWRELWDQIGPMLETAMGGVEGTYVEEQLLIMERHGYREETYYTFSYSPIPNDEGGVGGIICANTDDTAKVLSRRRLNTLRALGERALTDARTAEDAARAATVTLAENLNDIPFALVYLLADDGGTAWLAETVRLEKGAAAAPAEIELNSEGDVWRFRRVLETGRSQTIENLAEKFGHLTAGAWVGDATQKAAVLPLAKAGIQEFPAGFLVAGISPRLTLDDDYRSFLELAAGHIATAIANTRAYEEERKRAEALAEIDRVKTAFFSNVSHEFRTPLTLMLGPLEDTLAEDGLPPVAQERLEVAHRNSLRLLKLVNTLLDFSRIEAGRVQAVYEPIDLAALTADLASIFRSAIERAGMELVVDCPPLEEPVYVDREMWEKIVLNLLSNAFKFTFEGEIEVRLRIADCGSRNEEEREEKKSSIRNKRYATLTVRDSGAGIPAEEIPHLFERFHRVRGARGRSYEGSGIGLALVQELVRLHGGSVRVSSEVDRGSVFIVSVPTGSSHLPADRIGAARAPASTGLRGEAYVEEALRWLPSITDCGLRIADSVESAGRQAPRREEGIASPQPRILLADDNADMREYVLRLLSGRYEVVAVADGAAALEAARRQQFDLVLTDVMMPQLDGFGLLKALRADERTVTTPVILLSARAGEESRIEGTAAGADDYLVKPFSASELLARVEGRLDLQRLRREAQAALRKNEAWLSAVLQQLPVGLGVMDRNGRLTMSNAIMRAFVQEKIPSRDPRQMGRWRAFDEAGNPIPPEEWPSARALRGQTISSGMEMIYTADDGREIWTRVSSAPLRDEAGEIIGAIAVIEDIDERKRAEEALRESEGRFRNMADNAPVMVWVTEPDASCAYLSKSWYEFTGHTPETGLGLGWLDATHPDDRERAEHTFRAANAKREAFRFEYRLRRKDGEYRWAIDAASPRFGRGGEFLGYIGSVIDITERKQMEAERERLLADEQEAREIAEQATRAKDEFLAVVSHELRSPLNAILGWNHLLQSKRGDDPQIAKVTETIERSGKAQMQLIEDLLDMTRIITGKMKLESLPVELENVISSALDTVRPAADNKGIAITMSIDPKAGQITGDPDRLLQVVWNLLSNAIKFTPEGGRVWVELRRGDAGAQIVVRDTGQGIAPELRPYVFDRFKQGDASAARRFGGLGLGLALAKHLVELHGGGVAVESPGKGLGSTFTVNLPIRAVRGNSETDERRDGKAAPAQFTRRRPRAPMLEGARALVVDDEADARELLTATLEMHGVLVTSAGSADAALAEIEARLRDSEDEPFDVLISDVGMPGADGYELIRRVRAHLDERVSRVRAVALTAYARSEDRLRALQAGFYMHVPKPVDEEELITVIAALMGVQLR